MSNEKKAMARACDVWSLLIPKGTHENKWTDCNTFLRCALSCWVKAPGCVEGCMSHWCWGSSLYYNREKLLPWADEQHEHYHRAPFVSRLLVGKKQQYSMVHKCLARCCLKLVCLICQRLPNPDLGSGEHAEGIWTIKKSKSKLFTRFHNFRVLSLLTKLGEFWGLEGTLIYTKGLQSTLTSAWQLCWTCGAKGCCLH